MQLISQQAWQSSDRYARQFNEAQPFRYTVIDNFFDTEFCQLIMNHFPHFEDRFALNEMGQVGGKAVRTHVRDISTAYRELDIYLQTPHFLGYVSKITGIPDLLYDPDYVGGGTHENRDGQNLDAHVDFNYHPKTKTHRRLNLIVYLNPEWDDAWGGVLELQSDPWNPATNHTKAISPLFNRAVIFETTEHSWHGFPVIHLPTDKQHISRKSFALYLYTKERPSTETASPHATIYVPEGLPHDWEAGKILTTADMALLKQRFIRLRTQLHYLYGREKQDSAQITILENALLESRDAWRLPLEGFVKQPSAPQGIWSDKWVSPELKTRFVPQRTMLGIDIELQVPEQLDGIQILEIDMDGQHWQHQIVPGKRSNIDLKAERAAGSSIELSIHASSHFVPKKSGLSSDDRSLSWMWRNAKLKH